MLVSAGTLSWQLTLTYNVYSAADPRLSPRRSKAGDCTGYACTNAEGMVIRGHTTSNKAISCV